MATSAANRAEAYHLVVRRRGLGPYPRHRVPANSGGMTVFHVQTRSTTGGPLPKALAAGGVARCMGRTAVLLARGRVHLPRENVGRRLRFADGSVGRVYRETRLAGAAPAHPCVLVVCFRLRWVRGRGHAAFRAESLLNTPLFVGFPGFVSKLWLAHDEGDRYRGFYEWDGASAARRYAGCLWPVLALVSERASIDYRVIDGLHRDEVLANPGLLDGIEPAEGRAWWRLTAA